MALAWEDLDGDDRPVMTLSAAGGTRGGGRGPASRGAGPVGTRTGPVQAGRGRRGVRRIALGAVAVSALVVLAVPVWPRSGPGGAGRAAGGSLPVVAGGGEGYFYVVQVGDTLGTVAARMDPGDPAAARARIVAATGSAVLVPGEHIVVS